MKEKAVQRGIVKLLRQLGFAVYDLSQPRNTMQSPGLGDLYVIGHGWCIWVEVKTQRGRQTPAQVEFGQDVRQNGGTYLVWRSAKDAWDWLKRNGIVREAG